MDNSCELDLFGGLVSSLRFNHGVPRSFCTEGRRGFPAPWGLLQLKKGSLSGSYSKGRKRHPLLREPVPLKSGMHAKKTRSTDVKPELLKQLIEKDNRAMTGVLLLQAGY